MAYRKQQPINPVICHRGAMRGHLPKAFFLFALACVFAIIGNHEISLFSAAYAQTANPTKAPTKPTAEEELFKPEVICSRFYSHRSKVRPLDSSRKKDGEGLREVFKSNAEALGLLNDYQARSRTILWPAIVGTLGVSMIISGNFLDTIVSNQKKYQYMTRWGFIGAGVGLLGFSYFWGQKRIADSDKALDKAIGIYNSSVKEEDKIKIIVEPDQIKTQIKF